MHYLYCAKHFTFNIKEFNIMIYILITVYDKVTGTYSSPQTCINEAEAHRSFNCFANSSPFASDLQLYKIGTYDSDKGVITAFDKPVFMACCVKKECDTLNE